MSSHYVLPMDAGLLFIMITGMCLLRSMAQRFMNPFCNKMSVPKFSAKIQQFLELLRRAC